jgi:hypothetical protein
LDVTKLESAEPGTSLTEPKAYRPSHLCTLEAEAVHMMRDVVAELERPVLRPQRKFWVSRSVHAPWKMSCGSRESLSHRRGRTRVDQRK